MGALTDAVQWAGGVPQRGGGCAKYLSRPQLTETALLYAYRLSKGRTAQEAASTTRTLQLEQFPNLREALQRFIEQRGPETETFWHLPWRADLDDLRGRNVVPASPHLPPSSE